MIFNTNIQKIFNDLGLNQDDSKKFSMHLKRGALFLVKL